MPLKCIMGAMSKFRLVSDKFAASAALLFSLAAAAGFVAAAGAAPVQNAAVSHKKSGFVSYRAIYDITLENMAEKSDITGLNGRMAYEFSGSKCEGWTTQFRLLTHVDMKDDASRLTDRQSTSFEAVDGKEFRFATKNYLDGDLTEEVVGTARRSRNGLEVVLTKPDDENYKLKKAYFPLAQMEDIIKNALAGKHFMKMDLFDGSGAADNVAETTIIIGSRQKPAPDDREIKFMGDFADEPTWPVTIAYFDDAENKDGLPGYRTEFLLYENGITRNLFMDYGDFSIRGKLVRLDILQEKSDKAACKK
ncbi:cell envelope integrity EipB family protein [Candidatus Tokpelaia sp.]|uniref:cell envelope integrity EipB family protein n=1 Tax=Candidatus Tokpelaia sp. TaxID=2233777 RepID=UPI001FEDE0D8|nr:cell envelope integrity EipB family protein [Candidatus Tokpelaia sp.]